MNIMVKSAAGVALVASVVWAFKKPGYDSICTALGALVVLLGYWISEKKSASMSQTVGDNSTAIQAGRDANIRK